MTFEEALVERLGETPYNRELASKIEANRAKLNGELFIDVILRDMGGLDQPAKVYPPKNLNDLVRLLATVAPLAEQAPEKHACIVFYLFLHYPNHLTEPFLGSESLAEYYASQLDLSMGFQEVIRGTWHMDQLEYDTGVLHLSYPENNTDVFHEKVLKTLAGSGAADNSDTPSITAENARLVLSYITALDPALVTESSLDIYIKSLCSQSLYSALRAARNLSPNAFGSALQTIVSHALASQDKRDVFRLANFSFTNTENELLKELLTDIIQSDSPQRDNARDVLLVRSLHLSDVETAKDVCDATSASATNMSNLEWRNIASGVTKF